MLLSKLNLDHVRLSEVDSLFFQLIGALTGHLQADIGICKFMQEKIIIQCVQTSKDSYQKHSGSFLTAWGKNSAYNL